MSFLRALALGSIVAYQKLLGPGNRGACRFTPTCSAYAHEAIERHGVVRGVVLAIRRVSRCHPLGTSGLDPVP